MARKERRRSVPALVLSGGQSEDASAYIAADGPFERNEPVPKEPSFQAYILEAYATLSATPDFLTGLYRSTHTGN
jgi:hypothetical protein